MSGVSDKINYGNMINTTEYGPLIDATKVMGQWASVKSGSIIGLMQLAVDASEIGVEVTGFDETLFSLRFVAIGPDGASAMLDLRDEAAGITHVFSLSFQDADVANDELGLSSRINWLGSYMTEEEEFSLSQEIRPKLVSVAL